MRNSMDLAREIIENGEKSELSADDNFKPFLVQKYLSGISPAHCNLLNMVLNNRISVWNDNQQIFDFLKCVVPKGKGYLQYFGLKKQTRFADIELEQLCESFEITRKDLVNLLTEFPELEESLKTPVDKTFKKIK